MSSFNQDELKNYRSEQRNELPFASSVCHFGMYYEWIATWTHTPTVVSPDEVSEGFTYFALEKNVGFFCIFHYAIY